MKGGTNNLLFVLVGVVIGEVAVEVVELHRQLALPFPTLVGPTPHPALFCPSLLLSLHSSHQLITNRAIEFIGSLPDSKINPPSPTPLPPT